MLNWIWHSVAAQIGIAGLLIAGLLAVAWFVPFLRRWALGAAGLIFSAAAIYAKGASDQAKQEAKRKEEAVKKAQEDYAKIDARPDTPNTVKDRLDRGTF